MNETEFEDAILELLKEVSAYYEKELPEITHEFWFNSMKRFELNSVSKAFAIHMNTPDSGKFMPKIADIVKILDGTSKDAGFVAWTKVKESISQVGSYESICFDDPIIHLVIKDLGGWVHLCQSKEEQLKFIANEFRTRYDGYKAKGDIPKFPKRLAGLIESENTRNGFLDEIGEPILIGDKTKAKQVLIGNLPASNLKQLTK
ncbi:MAG: hypothetical protein GY941_23515 [Planctomycetes bacterium]|nr:hypothetical protein [Planctomycetota bacterium]